MTAQGNLDELADAVADRVVAKLAEQPDDRPPLNMKQVGERLGISERAARALVNHEKGREPRLASIVVGDGARRVEQAELDRYLAELRAA
jgi:hypothetical protein